MSVRMPLVVVIAACRTGKEGAGSIGENGTRKKERRVHGKKEIETNQTNKQTENMMQLAEAALIARVTPTPWWFHSLMVGW